MSPPAPRKPGYGRFMESARSTTSAISWFNPGHQFIAQQRERRLLDLSRRYGFAALQSKSILEVGCGTGQWLRDFVKWGAQPEKLAGIDLLADRLSTAQQLCPPGVRIQCADAAQLPFADAVFDLVFQSTVFTSILDSELRHRVAAEMMRVLKRDGVIVWYDYHLNNPSSRTKTSAASNDERLISYFPIVRSISKELRCFRLWREHWRRILISAVICWRRSLCFVAITLA